MWKNVLARAGRVWGRHSHHPNSNSDWGGEGGGWGGVPGGGGDLQPQPCELRSSMGNRPRQPQGPALCAQLGHVCVRRVVYLDTGRVAWLRLLDWGFDRL